MTDTAIALLAVAALFALVLSGVHVAFALLITSFAAMALLNTFDIALSLLAQSAYHAIFDYVFTVVPLFVLMGAFMTQSRAAQELYTFLNLVFRKVRGGLGIATVFSNAIFAAVTGASVASAAVFSKIALPQMYRYGYSKRLALGCVAGSSVLGMLIPPSLLMIIYGILTQVSIGRLFVAGIVPGLVLAGIYSLGIMALGAVRPQLVGHRLAEGAVAPSEAPAAVGARASLPADDADGEDGTDPDAAPATAEGSALPTVLSGQSASGPRADASMLSSLLGSLPVVALVVLVIGGIWGGLFTPTEASAVGAAGAFLIGKLMGMTWRGAGVAFKETAITTGAIMILLISAQMYSRMLAASGLVGQVGRFLGGLEVSPTLIVLIFIVILIVMGAVLDSASIILLAVPVMFPSVVLLDIDPLWFGIVLIVAVELGLLTPPFGMIPFTMSAVIGREVVVEDIFVGSFAFFLMMLVLIALMIVFPALVTWLPSLM
ncbi:MAG: TRAP transporter large permease subunit [Nitriliruptorales bacterium]|nr:TRAP transporter large permease subunit [Nitriliruptorales bacterium]